MPKAADETEWMLTDEVSPKERLLNDESSIPKRNGHEFFGKPVFCTLAFLALLATCTIISVLAFPSIWTTSSLNSDISLSASSTTCSQPRVRKEWRTLSARQKREYIQAVQCLTNIPSQHIPNGTLHDDFAYSHNVYGELSHNSASFLPWHRYFLYVYERTLQSRCQYSGTLPYWDWMQDWEHPLEASIWDSETGFGGNGNASTPQTVGYGHCVQEGPFANLQVQNYGEQAEPHCLSRGFISPGLRSHFGAQVINATAMEQVMTLEDFYEFTKRLEEGPHLSLPRLIQGDWRKHTAPNDPVFFLHHTQLDRLWWQWQIRENRRFSLTYSGPATTNSTIQATLADRIPLPMKLDSDSTLPSVAVKHLMLVDEGFLCYDYDS